MRQHGLQQLAYLGGRCRWFLGCSQREQCEAALQRRFGCGLGQLLQHVLGAALAGQAVGIHLPTVVAQHLPVFGAKLGRRGQRSCERFSNGAAAAGGDGQCPGQFGRVVAAGDAGDFVALRVEHDQCGIAAHAEAFAPRLRAFLVAVQVHRHEFAGQCDEGRILEQPGLELVARRAPHRAPVQQHRLATLGGFVEGIIHIALAPGDGGGRGGGCRLRRRHRSGSG
ncbi:hypothetical protein D3C81_1039670 [compost metagenome]